MGKEGNKRKRDSGSQSGSRKVKKVVSSGWIHIYASFNNTLITVTDAQGNALCQDSAGREYRGARKSTQGAAAEAAKRLAVYLKETFKMEQLMITIKGPGPGRDAAAQPFMSGEFTITKISDVTTFPFNGCRPPKRRKV